MFSIPYFSIPARRIPYDRSTMTDFFNTYVNHLALHVLCSLTNLLSKQPYTTPLDSLTFVIWVLYWSGLSYLKRCSQVLLFSLPAVLSCLLIHCLLTFSALPHCPRAWLRLKLSVMTIHKNFNWGLSGEGRKS